MDTIQAEAEIKAEFKRKSSVYVADYAVEFIRQNKKTLELIARGADIPYESFIHDTGYHWPGMTFEEARIKQEKDGREHMKEQYSVYMTAVGYQFLCDNITNMHILGLGVRIEPSQLNKVRPERLEYWKRIGIENQQDKLYREGKRKADPEYVARRKAEELEREEKYKRDSFERDVEAVLASPTGTAILDRYVSKGLMTPEERLAVIAEAERRA